MERGPRTARVAALRTPERALWKCRPVESVENSQNEFPTLSTGLGNPAQGSRIPTFPQRRQLSMRKETGKNEQKTEFQLTDSGHFKHHKNASVASLRKRPPSLRNK